MSEAKGMTKMMKIEIINGVYTRDEEAMSLLTSGEDEHMAAIAQKLVIRQERQRKKAEQEQEQERQKRIAMNRLINGDNFGL